MHLKIDNIASVGSDGLTLNQVRNRKFQNPEPGPESFQTRNRTQNQGFRAGSKNTVRPGIFWIIFWNFYLLYTVNSVVFCSAENATTLLSDYTIDGSLKLSFRWSFLHKNLEINEFIKNKLQNLTKNKQ